MKIYFAGSIRGGREDAEIYLKLIEYLKNYGIVLTEHISYNNLTAMGDELPVKDIHDRDMKWLNESDVLVADVTKVSLGVGYEIGRIVERNSTSSPKKKILCLYRNQVDKRLSAMIAGSEGFTVSEYNTLEDAKALIDNFFRNIDLL